MDAPPGGRTAGVRPLTPAAVVDHPGVAPILASLRREGGQTLPIVAMIMVGIIAIAGLVIDLGNVERVRAQMQNAADAAATSGASTLLDRQFDVARATDTARRFGMDSQGINQVAGVDTTTVLQRVQVRCDGQFPRAARPPRIRSRCTSSVRPDVLHEHLRDHQSGCEHRGQGLRTCTSAPHDIMLVLDRTGSMAAPGKGSSNGVRKIDNLKSALLQGFLPSLNGQDDRVGMVVFPPDTAGSPACSHKDNANNYRDYNDPTRNYLEVGLTGGYLNTNGTLNPSSPVIEDIDCMMPFSRTDYADSLMAAEREFDAHARPGVAKVIVMISTAPRIRSTTPSARPAPRSSGRARIPARPASRTLTPSRRTAPRSTRSCTRISRETNTAARPWTTAGRAPHEPTHRVRGHGADREPGRLPRGSRSGEPRAHPAARCRVPSRATTPRTW